MSRPKVILTRSEQNLQDLRVKYPEIEWIEFPLIRFDHLKLDSETKNQLENDATWLVFTSQNGVRSFFEQFNDVHLRDKKIACVGPKTSTLVNEYGYQVEYVPEHFTSLALANGIPISKEDTLFYLGGNLSRPETIDLLKDRVKKFIQLEVYHTVSQNHSRIEWQILLEDPKKMISFCSPSAVDSFVKQVGKYGLTVPDSVAYAAIGTTTHKSIQERLGKVAIIGEKHTFDHMIQAIAQVLDNNSQ